MSRTLRVPIFPLAGAVLFPRAQLPLVEDERFSDLKGAVPERNMGKFVEPVIVVAVVAGLIVLFF